eukprot:scaffold285813_cov12-Tisochrysis_lutea.AAC.1
MQPCILTAHAGGPWAWNLAALPPYMLPPSMGVQQRGVWTAWLQTCLQIQRKPAQPQGLMGARVSRVGSSR